MRKDNSEEEEEEESGELGYEVRVEEEEEEQDTGRKLEYDPRNWSVLLGYSGLSFGSGWAWITFAPRATSFTKYYQLTNPNQLDTLSTIFMITYPIFLLPGLYLGQRFQERERVEWQLGWKGGEYRRVIVSEREGEREREREGRGETEVESEEGRGGIVRREVGFGYGLKSTLILASLLHTLGCWGRYWGHHQFNWVWWGQAVASLCQVFTLGLPPKLATVWFPPHTQNLAIAIGVTSNVLGTATGFLLTPLMVDPTNLEGTIPNYLLFQSLLYTLQLLYFIFLFPVAPRCPPSTEVTTEPSAGTVLTTTRGLLSRPAFRALALSYGLVVGGQYTVQTLLVNLILPSFPDHTESEVGWLGFWMLLLGILASLVGGWYLDRTPSYFRFAMVLFLLTTLSLLTMNLSIEAVSFSPLAVSCLLYGMTSSTLIPTLFQCGLHPSTPTTSPSSDDVATIPGLLNFLAQLVGLTLITTLPILTTSPLITTWSLVILTTLGMVLLARAGWGHHNT